MKTLLICLMLTFLPTMAFAKNETIFASFKYTLGDNDTKNDAKRIAFMEAKRLLAEKAGVYIESETKVIDSMLSSDEIKSYTSAILKIDVVKEELQITGETQTIIMTVKADVDTDEVGRTLRKIHEDKSLQKKIKEQQNDLLDLEKKIKSLQNDLTTVDSEKAIQLRKERAVAFQQMNELEKIKFTIQAATKTAIESIEVAMTPNEVKRVAGNPRSSEQYGSLRWNYGKVWVVFEGGIVGCIVGSDVYSITNSCDFYRKYKGVVK